MELLFQLALLAGLLIVGLVVGSVLERRHYRAIRAREQQYRHILVFTEKQLPLDFAGQPFHLVSGSVVISSDYFKTAAAGLKSLVGGRLTSYETLLDRGRREAILRMKEEAAQHGARVIFNVRLDTVMLNQNSKNAVACAEVLAYGTAWGAPAHRQPKPKPAQTALPA